jgi:CubicO group peptidase (beta-lactamase class C family)
LRQDNLSDEIGLGKGSAMTTRNTKTRRSTRAAFASAALGLATACATPSSVPAENVAATVPPAPLGAQAESGPGDNPLIPTGTISSWIIFGPFPNPMEGDARLGLDRDSLAALGGEARFVPPDAQPVPSGSDAGAKATATPVHAPTGEVDFEKVLGALDHSVAYAFSWLISERDQDVRFYLGSDDGAKVWVNGEPAFRVATPGRPLVRAQDRFVARLKKGKNAILVKVEDNIGGWAFVLEAFDEAGYLAHARDLDVAKALIGGSIRPKGKWDYMFSTAGFPEIVWQPPPDAPPDPGGVPTLQVRWFNARLEEEKTPSGPGRYLAYAEGRTKNGALVRRGDTFFCRPKDWEPWQRPLRGTLNFIPGGPFEQHAWQERRDVVGKWFGQVLFEHLEKEPRGAIVASYLHEAKAKGVKPALLDEPWVAHSDAHVKLRRKILGLGPVTALRRPEVLKERAVALREGPVAEARIAPFKAQRIRAAARAWYEDSKEPFTVALARNGVVFFHEAFGDVQRDTRFPMSSITKFVAGLLLARFLDQGLFELDEPIGNYLPDWPKKGPKAITMRQCYTHTSGLGGLGEIHTEGVWLDNELANALPVLRPAERFEYNFLGYHLAGKVMETITGKSVPRLMYEDLLEPLGASPEGPPVLGYSVHLTALDLARLGQLTLNRGTYGRYRLFTDKTFAALLPRPLKQFYPKVDATVGLGVGGMVDKDPRAGKGGFAANKVLLSPNTLGHGAGSSTVFRVDPDHALIVAVGRRRPGKDYDKHLSTFLQAIDDAVR